MTGRRQQYEEYRSHHDAFIISRPELATLYPTMSAEAWMKLIEGY